MTTDIAQAAGLVLPVFSWVMAALLLSLRLAPVLVLTPLLQAFDVPPLVRVLLLLGLAGLLVAAWPQAAAPWSRSAAELALAAVRELALGFVLALAVWAAFAAVSLAGRLIDVQMGLGIGQVFDPVSRRDVPLVSSAFDKLGVVLFFALNGHHAILRGLSASLERFPLGQPWSLSAAAQMPLQMGALFGLGFSLAAPVVVCLLLVELALGVVARNLPQINMLVLGVPVKLAVGAAALAIWLGGIGDAMGRVYASIDRAWSGFFAAAAAATGAP